MSLRLASLFLLLLPGCIYLQPAPIVQENTKCKEEVVRKQVREYLVEAQKIVAAAKAPKGGGFEAAVARAILDGLADYPEAVWKHDKKKLREIILNAIADVAERFGYVPSVK